MRCWSRVNQIGTLTETLDAVSLAQRNSYVHAQPSLRARPKTRPSPTWPWRPTAVRSRPGPRPAPERVAKYNQLMRIEEELEDAAVYPGASAFRRFDL